MADIQVNPLQAVYEGLATKNPQLKELGFESFQADMQDSTKLQGLYDGLSSKNPQLKERGFDGFRTDMFGGTQPTQPEAEQSLTPIQKELRQEFPENYTKEQQPEEIQQPQAKEEKGFFSTWLGDAMQGFAGTTMDIVGNMGGLSNLPMRSYLNYKAKEAGIGDEERKVFVDTFLQTNPATSAGEGLKISAKAEAKKLEAKSDRYNGEDFTDKWKQGDYGAVAGDIFLQGAKSLPYMVMAMGGGVGGLTAIGATSAAGKYDELDKPELPQIYTEKQKADFLSQMNMGEFQKLTNSVLTGASEAGSEFLGSVPMGKYIGRLVAKAGKPAAQKMIQKGVSVWVTKMFDRYGLLVGPVSEGIEEVANSLATDVIDRATGANTDLEAGEMVSKAAKSFVYGVGGGSFGSLGAGAVMGYNKLTGQSGSEQPANSPVSPDSTPQFTVNPRDTRAAEIRQQAEGFASKTSGNIQAVEIIQVEGTDNVPGFVVGSFTGADGKEIFRVQEAQDPTKFHNLTEKQLNQVGEQSIDEFVASQMGIYDQNLEAKELLAKNQVQVDGKQYILTGDQNEEGYIAVSEDGSDTVIPTRTIENIRNSGQQNANVITETYGKTTITGIKDEQGNTLVSEPATIDQANTLKESVEEATGGNATIQAELIPNEDVTAPQLFQLSIIPKVNEPVINETVTDVPSGDNGLKAEAPIERKITPQKFGATTVDIIENEEFDEVVPSDKVPFEKALPALEKEFKDNEDFELQVEKVQVEVPAENKYKKPTYKTVIKSIKIVPKVAKNANNSEIQSENITETQNQSVDDLLNTLFAAENNSQNNQQNEKPVENINEVGGQPAVSEIQDTPQAQQGQGELEGLEENVKQKTERLQKEKEQIEKEIAEIEKQISDIENNNIQGSYDFSASSNSGKWNSANTDLETAVSDHRKAFSVYKFLIGDMPSFKEIVDFINKRTDANIEYTERMRRADETMTAEEIQSAIDSYNSSANNKVEDKAQIEKDILNENGLQDETEYTTQELIARFPLSGVQKVIWNIIKNIVGDLGIKVKFSSSRLTEGFDGSNNPLTGEILIRPSSLKNGRFAEVLVHEIVHALTTKIINKVNSGNNSGLSKSQIDAVKGLTKLYEAIKNDNNLQDKYPVKDVFEFIAHLTNENFVSELQSKDKNFIQKVIDYISDILGINNANDLAKEYLKDIISDGVFLQENGITVLSSDYSNTQGSENIDDLKQRLSDLKTRLSEINDELAALQPAVPPVATVSQTADPVAENKIPFDEQVVANTFKIFNNRKESDQVSLKAKFEKDLAIENDVNISRKQQGVKIPNTAANLEEVLRRINTKDTPVSKSLSVPELTEEQKITAHNKVIDLVDGYNSLPRNHTNKKRIAYQQIQAGVQRLGYSFAENGGKLEIQLNGKKIQRIGTRQTTEDVQAHKGLNDYPEEVRSFIQRFIDNPTETFGLDLSSTTKQAEQGIKNIREGKKTVAANDVLDSFEKMFNDGVIRIKGSGVNGYHEIPIEEYLSAINEQLAAIDVELELYSPSQVDEWLDEAQDEGLEPEQIEELDNKINEDNGKENINPEDEAGISAPESSNESPKPIEEEISGEAKAGLVQQSLFPVADFPVDKLTKEEKRIKEKLDSLTSTQLKEAQKGIQDIDKQIKEKLSDIKASKKTIKDARKQAKEEHAKDNSGKLLTDDVVNAFPLIKRHIDQQGKLQREYFKLIANKEKLIDNIISGAKAQNEINWDTPVIPQSENKEPSEYKYHLTLRPFNIGTYPKENFVRYEDDGTTHGVLVYSEKVPARQIDHFSLSPITEAEALNGKVVDVGGYEWTLELKKNRNDYNYFEAIQYDNGEEVDRMPLTSAEVLSNIENKRWTVKEDIKLKTPEKPVLDVLEEGKKENVENQEVKSMVNASDNLPQTVRELADLDAGTQDGLLSAAVFSVLEQGDQIKLGRDKTVTVTRKTKPTKQNYSIEKNGKTISGTYDKVALTLTDSKGNKYSGELWTNWYSDGKKMVSRWTGRGQTKKSDPWGQLSREIEGDISVDLINEYNRFHDVSDSFNLVKKYLDQFNAEQGKKEVQEKKPVQVKLFKHGEGGTKGLFEDSKGNLYKSLIQTWTTFKDGEFIKNEATKDSPEYEILKALQGNPNIPVIGERVITSEGAAFEIERLEDVDKLTLAEFFEIEKILDNINGQGFFVNDIVTVMRRPKTGELVIVDFSGGLNDKALIGNSSYSDNGFTSRLFEMLSEEDKAEGRRIRKEKHEALLEKYFGKKDKPVEPEVKETSIEEKVKSIDGKIFTDKDGNYRSIEVKFVPDNTGAYLTLTDKNGKKGDRPMWLNAKDVIQNIEEGYWTESKQEEKAQYEFTKVYSKPKFISGLGQYETQVTYGNSTFSFYSNTPDVNWPKSFKDDAAVDAFNKELNSKPLNIAPTPQTPEYGANNKLVSKDRFEELKRKMREKGNNLNSGFDPELFAMGAEMAAYHIEAGARKFAEFSKAMIDDLGDWVKPYLKSFYNGARDFPGMESYEPDMTEHSAVKAADIDKEVKLLNESIVKQNKNNQDVPNRPRNSEPDSENAADEVPEDAGNVQGNRGRSGKARVKSTRGGSRAVGRSGSKVGSGLFADLFGEQSDNELRETDQKQPIESDDAGDTDGRGSRTDGTEGLPNERGAGEANNPNNQTVSGTFAERTAAKLIQQKAAENIQVVTGDIDNIRETLPLLLSEQQDDVLKAETRFFDPKHQTKELANGKGMLFTNGTGTGKTYTGLGIVKRFVKQGKVNVLIVVPSEAKVNDWAAEGKNLGLNITPLANTTTGGTGQVVTTYANFRENQELLKREFDLVVYDESHRLMEEKKGATSSTTTSHYAISNKDLNSALGRLKDVHPVWIEQRSLLKTYTQANKNFNANMDLMDWQVAERVEEIKKMSDRIDYLDGQIRELLPGLTEQAKQAVERTKVVFLSATPFKGHFNLRYANGILFDWSGEITMQGRSRVDAESRFFLDNFGGAYEWRYHKLQARRNSNADAIAMQEVQFAQKLMSQGVMSGRAIESDKDYSREFPLVALEQAETFNKALNEIHSEEFDGLAEAARNVFSDYNYTTKLFESLKASMSIERIKDHLALGRKVIVFHRRKQANVRPPFQQILDETRLQAQMYASELQDMEAGEKRDKLSDLIDKMYIQIEAFQNKYADLLKYELTLNYSPAIDQIMAAFPGRVVTMNGDTPKKDKSGNVKLFNDDNSGKDIFVVQEEAGKEGISLHDTTGKHQRVLISLSLPISSTTALQIEGRPYRIGNESDAIFEYPLLGLDQEIIDFGSKVNKKLSTTENLAIGDQARDLLRSFAEGVLFNSGTEKPHSEQGKGGKEYDKKAQETLSEFRKAVLVYNTNQKTTGRRDQREGVDYFATPEPVGQKMVEWLNLQPGETGLEPSAGHGAIAMWFPNHSNITAIEPSFSLYSKLNARSGGGDKKIVNSNFEDFNIINKFNGVAMNPPFGSGGKTAMDHVEKSFHHLKDGGRLVAIIPNGPSMAKRLDNFLYGENDKGKLLNPEAYLIGEVQLPSVAFEQAGTAVSSRIVIIERHITAPESLESGFNYDLSDSKNVNELFDAIESIEVPRTVRAEQEIDRNTPIMDILQNAKEGNVKESTGSKLLPVEEFKHTQTGQILYNVKINGRSDEYDKMSDIGKKHNPYTRNRAYNKYSKGFLFNTKDDAIRFKNEVEGNQEPMFSIIGEKGAANIEGLVDNLESTATVKSDIYVMTSLEAAEKFKGEVTDAVYEKMKLGFGAMNINDKIILTPELSDIGVIKAWVHEKIHTQINTRFDGEKEKQDYLGKFYDVIGKEEIERVIPVFYHNDSQGTQVEEYITHLSHQVVDNNLDESIDQDIKKIIFGLINEFTTIKNIQDAKRPYDNTSLQRGNTRGSKNVRSNDRAGRKEGDRTGTVGEIDSDTGLRQNEGGAKGKLDRNVPIMDVLSQAKSKVMEKNLSLGDNIPMTEKEFYKKYEYQHKDIRSNGKDKSLEILKQIQETGFRSGAYALPVYKGGKPQNIIQSNYGPKKGDMIYLVPKEWVKTHKVNPTTIKEGWKPTDNELIEIEYDNQSSYEAYKNKAEKLNQPTNTILINGVSRSTLNSLGKPIAATEEGIRNFWKWFGDSKVVDGEGRPLVVYHGTNQDFDEFHDKYHKESFFFTSDKELALSYGSRTMEAYLSLKSPLETQSSTEYTDTFYDKEKRGDYDGIIYNSETEKGEPINSIVAFRPNQIKSATGNNGSFDPTDNNINFSIARNEPVMDYSKRMKAEVQAKRAAAVKVKNNPQKVRSAIDRFRTALQDNLIAIKKMQENFNLEVKPFSNVYWAANQKGSKAMGVMEQWAKKYFTPMEKAIGKLMDETGASLDEVSVYMNAAHSPERNKTKIGQNIEEDTTVQKSIKELSELKAAHKKALTEGEYEIAQVLESKIEKGKLKIEKLKKELREKYDGDHDNFSGFTTNDANAIIEEFESKASIGSIENLWEAVNNANERTARMKVEYSLMTEEGYNRMKAYGWKRYVPKMGWRTDADDLELDYEKIAGQGELKGNHRMKQRSTVSDDPIANMYNVANSAILLGEKNFVKRVLWNLIKTNPKREDLFTMDQVYYMTDEAGHTDEVMYDRNGTFTDEKGKEQPDYNISTFEINEEDGSIIKTLVGKKSELAKDHEFSMTASNEHLKSKEEWKGRQHEVRTTINGRSYTMITKDPAIANAVNGLNMSKAVPYLARYTRFRSAMMTTFAPMFALKNTHRDFSTAVQTTFIEDGVKASAEFVAQYPKAAHFLAINLNADPDGNVYNKAWDELTKESPEALKWKQWYDEYNLKGGRTGHSYLMPLDEVKSDVEKRIAKLRRGKILKGANYANPMHVANAVKACASYGESIARFATYTLNREAGKSIQESINAAKNVTTNFDVRGTAAPAIGSFMMFFNARVQGIQKQLNLAKHHPVRYSIASIISLAQGFFLQYLWDLMNPDDDDDDYKPVSDFTKQTSSVIGFADNYFVVPAAQGFRLWNGLGTILYDATLGNKINATEASIQMVNVLSNEMSPVDLGGVFTKDEKISLNKLAGTAFSAYMPFAEWITNENFMQNQIYKEAFTKGQENKLADSQQHGYNVNYFLKTLTDANFKAGGGDPTVNSNLTADGKEINWWRDINPTMVEHFANGLVGGPIVKEFLDGMNLLTVAIIKDAAEKINNDESKTKGFDINKVPVVSGFLKKKYTGLAADQFREIYNYADRLGDRQSKVTSQYDMEKINQIPFNQRTFVIEVEISNKMIKEMLDAKKLTKDEETIKSLDANILETRRVIIEKYGHLIKDL